MYECVFTYMHFKKDSNLKNWQVQKKPNISVREPHHARWFHFFFPLSPSLFLSLSHPHTNSCSLSLSVCVDLSLSGVRVLFFLSFFLFLRMLVHVCACVCERAFGYICNDMTLCCSVLQCVVCQMQLTWCSVLHAIECVVHQIYWCWANKRGYAVDIDAQTNIRV